MSEAAARSGSVRGAQTLAFHAAESAGDKGYVLLLEHVDADGWVNLRRWESPDYTAPAVERRVRASELRATLAREARAGWRFTLAPERIYDWLAGVAVPESDQPARRQADAPGS